METIGYFILSVIVFFKGKFIYDSYITNKTEKEWMKYKDDKEFNKIKVDNIKPSIDEIQLKQSRAYLAQQFNCTVDDFEQVIINDNEKEMTTEQQALDTIKMLEEGIHKEVTNLNLKRENTSSYLLQKCIEKYIQKINNEYIEKKDYFYYGLNRDDYITSKRNYFNFTYSIKYLAEKEFNVLPEKVFSVIEEQASRKELYEVLREGFTFKQEASVLAKNLPIRIDDTPQGIKSRVYFYISHFKYNELREFVKQGNALLNESIEKNQSYVKNKLINNLRAIRLVQMEFENNENFILDWINILDGEYKSILEWFPEIR